MAAPLGHDSQPLPSVVKEIVTKARTTWLKNDEVLKILLHYKSYGLSIGREAPKSPGGRLSNLLFNRWHELVIQTSTHIGMNHRWLLNCLRRFVKDIGKPLLLRYIEQKAFCVQVAFSSSSTGKLSDSSGKMGMSGGRRLMGRQSERRMKN